MKKGRETVSESRGKKREEVRGQDRKGMHEKLHIMKELNSEKESKEGIAMVTQGKA